MPQGPPSAPGWAAAPDTTTPAGWEPAPESAATSAATPPPAPSTLGYLKNVVTSGARVVGGIASAAATNLPQVPDTLRRFVADPLGTTVGVGAEAIAQGREYVGSRYYARGDDFGTAASKTLGTLYNDPVGSALDISTLAGGVEGATKGLGLAKTASVAGKVAEVTNPLSVPLKAAGAVARPVYESAFGPAATAKLATRKPGAMGRAFKAGYTNLKQVESRLKEIDTLQTQAVADAMSSNPPPPYVSTSAPLNHPEYKAVQAKYQHFPEEAAQVTQAAEPFIGAPPGIPLDHANVMRKVYNERTASAFEKGRPPQPKATMQANLALRDGITEEVYNAIPELKLVNAEDSELISFHRTLQKAISTEPSLVAALSDPLLVSSLTWGVATGYWRYAVAAGVRDILQYPSVKLKLGQLLRKAGEQSGQTAVTGATTTRIAATPPPPPEPAPAPSTRTAGPPGSRPTGSQTQPPPPR